MKEGTRKFLVSASDDVDHRNIHVEDLDHLDPEHENFTLTAVLHHRMFEEEQKVAEQEKGRFEWDTSNSFSALREQPRAIVEPCFNREQMNMIHHAAQLGSGGFLELVLIKKADGTKDSADGSMLGWKSRQKLSFFALMAKDKRNKTPLKHAIESGSSPAVKAILDCYEIFLSQDFALPYAEGRGAREFHVSAT